MFSAVIKSLSNLVFRRNMEVPVDCESLLDARRYLTKKYVICTRFYTDSDKTMR
jgi:hypothetical protein